MTSESLPAARSIRGRAARDASLLQGTKQERFRRLRVVLLLISAVAYLGCSGDRGIEPRPRGFVLISLSGLRADATGFQGRQPSPSPFLDELAERALVYERALSTSPATLAAHVSMLSGLYPAEHRVVPPEGTLAADAPVLAERFAGYGYRTGGFTGGGYLSADFGFDRGFDRFETSTGDGESPFDRAVRFVRGVGADPFFVFVHSDALEDALFEGPFALARLIAGHGELTTEVLGKVEATYFEALARLDREVARFVDEIEALDSRGRPVVAITADHGFEFGEHGRVGHAQVYPETLGVPLLVLGPGLKASRIATLAQTVDIAPSFYALAGLPMPALSGRTLPGLADAAEPRRWAVAEARGRWAQQALFLELEGHLYESVRSELGGEHDGTWVTRKVTFDTLADQIEFSIVSFLRPRTLRASLDGHEVAELEVGPRWVSRSLPLARQGERKRLTIAAADCESPSDAGAGADRRCLSFKLRGLELSKTELFNLSADPRARVDLSFERSALSARLRRRLARHRWQTTAAPGVTRPRAPTVAAIRARGEYPESPRP